jgi:hypothetical protein
VGQKKELMMTEDPNEMLELIQDDDKIIRIKDR